MFQIDKAFNPETLNVHSFFQKPGVGLYIPLYQREYSWDKDNIGQLLEDISQGLNSITENSEEIRFLGTVIAVLVKDKRTIYPIDPQGLPSSIENIIDGQQRLSTIALFSTLLYYHISEIQKAIIKSKNPSVIDQVNEVCNDWLSKLKDIFSIDLRRGKPNRKPKIIRGNKDQWTKDGDINANYKSNVANYLAQFINYVDEGIEENKLPKFPEKSKTGDNLKQINNWLKKNVIKAHVNQEGDDDFITAELILKKINQDHIWQYSRIELEEIILDADYSKPRNISYLLASLVQLFAVCHYLLERCCFTIIQPMNEDWAFDMFQSLNATGTPLTAIETFKPSVVNFVEQNKGQFKNSSEEKSLEQVDALFKGTKSAAKKNSLTREFLTSLALTVDGYKLSSHFSQQRKWLMKVYKNLESSIKREEFVAFLGNYASFYKDVWIYYKGNSGVVIELIKKHPEASLASLLVKYLCDSNHKMSIIILGRLYAEILQEDENAISRFVRGVKLVTRFYTLWRSARSNAKLDIQYRNFMKDPSTNAWLQRPKLDLDALELYFDKVLTQENLLTPDLWRSKAISYLRYDTAQSVCKLALFISADNKVIDSETPGLMKQGKLGIYPCLSIEHWVSPDFKTIEHVAPQKGYETWDANLYEEEKYQSIGNLSLLPTDINSSVGNKDWQYKFIYYRYLSEGDPDKQNDILDEASEMNIELNEKALELLKQAKYSTHVLPLVQEGVLESWDVSFVEKRAERILDFFWQWLVTLK